MYQDEILELIRTTYDEIGEANSSARSRVGHDFNSSYLRKNSRVIFECNKL